MQRFLPAKKRGTRLVVGQSLLHEALLPVVGNVEKGVLQPPSCLHLGLNTAIDAVKDARDSAEESWPEDLDVIYKQLDIATPVPNRSA